MKGKKKSRIAILTGGGDVPGLNPCIKTLVYRAESEGIVAYSPDISDTPDLSFKCYRKLTAPEVRTIDRSGGTYLHTSRTNPSAAKKKDVPDFLKKQFEKGEEVKDFTSHVLENLEHLEIDAIIPLGGDDTLSFADRLHGEGFPVIAIPKTMDNDVFGTDYCIGFSTAITRSVSFIHALRTSTGSHERIAVIELQPIWQGWIVPLFLKFRLIQRDWQNSL
jgi:6-phosphofructokinase 1